MKIVASAVEMTSQHSLVEQDVRQESLETWVGNREGGNQAISMGTVFVQDSVEISASAKKLWSEQAQAVDNCKAADKDGGEDINDVDKQKLRLIQSFIEALTGKRIKFVLPRKISAKPTDGMELPQQTDSGQTRQNSVGWGLSYDLHQSHSETEATTFTAKGIVKTAAGKEIKFSLDMALSRQFVSEQNISIRAGDALKDPLVINFDGAAAKLTAEKYRFDIDSDGEADSMSFVAPSSGFLALDKNNDGIINDGSELFGTKSGNGFADLQQYDIDGNNWIDENDSIYSKLRIWTKDENGNDQLFALGQKGIGAIYLGNIGTEFAMKDATNQQQGQLRSTGLFLRENGTAGTVQQIDLVV